MKRQRTLWIASVCVFLFLLLTGAGWFFLSYNKPPPRVSGTLPQQIYVWQRAWKPEVGQGIERAASSAAGFVILGAEVAWQGGPGRPPVLVRPAIDFACLRRVGRPLGVALRVGAHPGAFGKGEPAELLARLAKDLLAQAKAAGAPVQELQIDYDCAASKLEEYTRCIAELRPRLPGVPLAITALPSWLKRREFSALAHEAGRYILQVHSLSPPRDTLESLVLCDPAAARAAVKTAARIGVPFSVALPTYTYVAGFDAAGKLQGMFAEGGVPESAATADGAHLRIMRANADEIAGLVKGWTLDRPAALGGIYWYRLPVEGDRFNWRWPALAAVMAGRAPRVSLATAVRWPEAGRLAEVELINDGEADAPMPSGLLLDWSPTDVNPMAADGLGGWEWVAAPVSGQRRWRFVLHRDAGTGDNVPVQGSMLPSGARKVVGWIRFEKTIETLHVKLETSSR